MTDQRQIEFLYYKVNKAGVFQADVTEYVQAGTIRMDMDLSVKFQARFTIEETDAITFLSDYFMPVMRITEAGSMVDYELGIYRLGFPKRRHGPDVSLWDIDAYDLSVILLEDLFDAPYTADDGDDPLAEAKAIAEGAGLSLFNFPDAPSSNLTADMTWEVGTSKLRAISNLCNAGGCWTPWMEDRGYLVTRLRQSLDEITPTVAYTTDENSMVMPNPATIRTDATRFANKVIVRVNNPDLDVPITGSYTNSNPDSPISTVSLGRTICKVIDSTSIQTQADADAYAQALCEQAASVYLTGYLYTGLDPSRTIHEAYTLNVYRNGASPLLSGKWWCRGWTMPLKLGGPMKHEIAKVQAVA